MNIICIALNATPLNELLKLADDGCTFDIEDGRITGVYGTGEQDGSGKAV